MHRNRQAGARQRGRVSRRPPPQAQRTGSSRAHSPGVRRPAAGGPGPRSGRAARTFAAALPRAGRSVGARRPRHQGRGPGGSLRDGHGRETSHRLGRPGPRQAPFARPCGARRLSARAPGPVDEATMADPRLQRTSRELFLAVLTGGAPDLETWVIDRLTSVVDEEDVAAGKRLFARGEQPEYIFFSGGGRLRLDREGRPGWLFEGRTVVGVFDALLDRPHERTAVALTDLHLLKLRVEHWLELLEDSFGLVRAAVGNASHTVAALEARGWAAQTAPRGLVLAQVPAFAGPLSFVDRLAIFAEAPLLRGA